GSPAPPEPPDRVDSRHVRPSRPIQGSVQSGRPWAGEDAGMAGQGGGPPVVGVDLGGTKILAAVFAADNTILGRAKVPTPAHEGEAAILQAILACADEAIAVSRLERGQIAAAGIGAPGPLDP